MGELEAIRRRHLLETADGNCAGSYSWDPEGWHRPQGHDLDLAVEDIGKLLARIEELEKAAEAAKDVAAFEAWWNADVPTPAIPEIGLYPAATSIPRRIYFGGTRDTAWAAWQAALAALELKP